MTVLTSFARWTGAVRTDHAPGVTRARRRSIGVAPPSFTDLLPWTDYLADEQVVLLEDGVSRGAVFELTPTSTEGRTEEFLARQADALRSAVNGSFPELDDGEWIVQFFAQDDPRIDSVYDELVAYVRPEVLGSEYTQDYLRRMRAHLDQVSRPGGLFVDTEVSGIRFRGQRRRIRAVVYRRQPASEATDRDGIGPAEQLRNVCERFEASLRQGGVHTRRCTGRDFYEWLLAWFNPRPEVAPEGAAQLLKVAPYPGDDDLPFGRDFADLVLLSKPKSDVGRGLWYFDELPHVALTLQQLRNKPVVGHLTAERQFDDGRYYALFDKLPDGAILSLTLTMRAQDRLRAHVDAIERAATGDSPEAELSKENCHVVKRRMAEGDKLLPLNMVLYLRGDDELDLRRKVNHVNATLLPSGLKFIDQRQDLVALTAYIRGLPMAFDPAFDLRHLKRSRLVFSSDVARLLPIYGRARGTGRPGMIYFNRAGEPLMFDPLHRQDRKKNAHLVLFGPTGAGKSAACAHKLMLEMAVHRPRLFLLEVGGSFTLLGEHFRRLGLSVNQVTLSANADISLPPFADAYTMLDQIRRPELTIQEDDVPGDDDDEPSDGDDKRDILGEMEIAARVMITGGDERENAKLTRADRYLIRLAIIEAAKKARAAGRPQLMTEDVATELQGISADKTLPEARRIRAIEMGDGMKLFCDGLAGRFFNRCGTPWPDVDVTIVDLGLFAREGYEDQLTVAFMSFMNHVHALVESRQHEARQTIVTVDEAHIITASPLLSPYLTKISKMWRKLGTWLWLLTQNLGDFPDSARRMLSMIEWWICLAMPLDEVEQVRRFRNLSPETVRLLLSARKEPGKYTEGVVLTDTFEALFRNVPPALALALAMTEKHEKAQRAAIMRQRGCSELDAAYRVAELIESARG